MKLKSFPSVTRTWQSVTALAYATVAPEQPGRLTWCWVAAEFEWDPEEARGNEQKHGVTFEEATDVFADDLSSTVDDPDHSESEARS